MQSGFFDYMFDRAQIAYELYGRITITPENCGMTWDEALAIGEREYGIRQTHRSCLVGCLVSKVDPDTIHELVRGISIDHPSPDYARYAYELAARPDEMATLVDEDPEILETGISTMAGQNISGAEARKILKDAGLLRFVEHEHKQQDGKSSKPDAAGE
jgi:hypothetical protein